MNLVRLNVGGKTREFHFGLGFIGAFLEASKISMSEIDAKLQENPFKYIPEMMYHSLKYAELRNKNEIDFDAFDVSEWIDEAGGIGSQVVVDFSTAFFQSLTKDVPKAEEDKKKVT